ncbi:MAG: PorP/SprF family type IX secretion system membrane protein [Saprospiraceae bacterium]|nr:PorP/SprF family type IX secretion system membrane protein [Saprospiraceae bacterium]
MKIGKLYTLIIVLLISMNNINAQDMHFSQFYVSNLTLNPATTGVMSCNMRVSAIYRNQWASVAGKYAFNTFGLGVEGKINAGKKDYVGLGLSVWVDRAGASAFTSIQAAFSGSYLKKIGGRNSNEQYLVAGAQVGFNQRSIRLNELRWGSNWDGTQYNGTLPDNENLFNQNLTVADLSAGVLWFCALDKKNKNNIYAGIGFQHLTRANLSFIKQGTEPLFTRFSIHGGAEGRVGRRTAIVPNFAVFIQGPSTQLNVGTGIKFDFSKKAKSNQAFTIGAYMRGANQVQVGTDQTTFGVDAIIALLRMRFGSSHFGFSYDINVSQLVGATRANGGFELSYVWTLCQPKGRKLGCPTF